MRISCKSVLASLCIAIVATMASHAAAQVTISFTSGPIQTPGYSPGYSQYSYTLTTDAGTHLAAGDAFTIMGLNGIFNAVAPSNFTATDNLSLQTATFTYTGPTTGTGVTVSGFEINTSPGYSSVGTGSFTATGTNSGGSLESDSGTVGTPALNPTSVPEPAPVTAGLLGTLMFGAYGLRKFKADRNRLSAVAA